MLNKIKEAARLFLINMLMGKEGDFMMAMLFAQQIIFGKYEFKNVPAKLKPRVKEILIDSGVGDLAVEE